MTGQRASSSLAAVLGESIMKRIAPVALLLLFWISTALGADASERRFIREGMSEGDVLMKIGKPDSESVDTGGGAKVTVKRWIYLPTSGDQQTMTTLVLKDGKVIEVHRKVSN
jgi:hypothetical protein